MALTNNNIFSIMKYYKLVLLGFFFFSCDDGSKLEKEIEKIPINVDIIRFDKEFAAATPETLPRLKAEFPAFFPKQYSDSVWIEKLKDTLQNQLEAEVVKMFPKDEILEDELVPLFQHIKYYFPQFSAPLVVTTTSDVDYRNKIILVDSMLIIGLDNYLGADHRFYEGIDKYISK